MRSLHIDGVLRDLVYISWLLRMQLCHNLMAGGGEVW